MTTATTPTRPSIAPVLADAPRAVRDARAVLAAGAVVSGAALLVSLTGLVVDDRVLAGAPAWLKPTKFGVSITVYVLTLRWLVTYVPGSRRLLVGGSAVVVGALVAELALVDLQVVRGTTSHFNDATTFDTAVFDAMGGLIALIFLVTLALAVRALRTRGLDAGLAAGLRWGTGVCLLGMAEAGLMIANRGWDDGGGHTVGAVDGGPGLPLTGWSTLHGDLRVAHFVGLHALQVLPLLAALLARGTDLGARTRGRLVTVAGAGYAGLVLLLAWQAQRGQPVLHPDPATLLALTGLVVAAAGAGSLVLRRR